MLYNFHCCTCILQILHHDLDKEKRKNEGIGYHPIVFSLYVCAYVGRDCNAEFVNKLSCDLKEKTDQLDVTRQMLRGTQMELEDVKQRETKLKTELENVKQLHSQQQGAFLPCLKTLMNIYKFYP